MKPVEVIVILMCAVVAMVMVGGRLKTPYPIALVIGGLLISLVPGLPLIRVEPDLVFLIFLPPLLYAAGWVTSWNEFRANLRPVFMLAFGLVLFTTLIVGFVMHWLIPQLPLAVACAFGAIVSPPDAVAVTALAQRMHLPKRIVTVLEGESLINDATGLVALRFALAATMSGTFSLSQAALQFVWVAAGGIGIGLVVGMLMAKAMRLIKEDALFITVSFLIPYIAYLPAERLGVSGVLAAVVAGIHGGWKEPELMAATTRLNAEAVWTMLVFILNCVLFVLIGIELPQIVSELGHHSTWQLIGYGALACGLVIMVRPIWVFPASWLPRLLSRRVRKRDPIPPWRHIAVVSWSGMRGVVSLAAALALPLTLENGQPFPERDLVIFLTYCVIFVTLVLQGLSMPLVVRWLGVKEQRDDRHERQARLQIAQAALDHLKRLAEHKGVSEAALKSVTSIYEERIRHLNDAVAEALGWSDQRERFIATRNMLLEAIRAERRQLIKLHREHKLDDELMRRMEHEMDLAETKLRS